MKKGFFLVIDGSDGSGKATQSKLLFDRLKKSGCKVCLFDFPQYDLFFGKFLKECLNGKFGDFADFQPEFASFPYALDRFMSKDKIKKLLNEGYFVISNRYTSSNLIHQGGKIKNIKDKKILN